MSDPLPLGNNLLLACGKQTIAPATLIKKNSALFVALATTILSLAAGFTASADTNSANVQSPIFNGQTQLFQPNPAPADPTNGADVIEKDSDSASSVFAGKIYALVGDAPIKEMVPFISQRDQRVAAFLVGIADKESGLGSASPSKDGKTCYNYWGYKGEGGRGDGMGYACFASPQEAVETVGDRIQSLVDDADRSTPAEMVDTWKCGTSCAGDPGAPSWVSTVAVYFNQLVDKNS